MFIGIVYVWFNFNQFNVGNMLIVENFDLENVFVVVRGFFGIVFFGIIFIIISFIIFVWGCGNSYDENSGFVFFQGIFILLICFFVLIVFGGRYFIVFKLYYEDQFLFVFFIVCEFGVKGDGFIDDIWVFNCLFEVVVKRRKIVYINVGMYCVICIVFILFGFCIFGDFFFFVILLFGCYFENLICFQLVV